MRVLVASRNPVKLSATEEAFRQGFGGEVEVHGLAVESGVPDQPLGGQTWQGAIQRAGALSRLPDAAEADYCVGVEGGIERAAGCWLAFGAVCVRDREGREGLGSSPRFQLPESFMTEIAKGRELGEVMDEFVGERDTKRRGGAIEYLSNGAIDRRELYRSGILVALTPFLRPEPYRLDSGPPRVEGVVETALYVADLDRSEDFYRSLIGGEVLYSDDRLRALSVGLDQVLLLFLRGGSTAASEVEGGTIPPHDGSGQLHVAFAVERSRIDAWLRKMASIGVELESRVDWPRGGISLYFRDPDGHAIEFVTRGCWSIF